MPTLLHLDAAANRSEASVSRRLTARFAERWVGAHGRSGYRYRDLAADPAPPIDTAFCNLGRRVEHAGGAALASVAAHAVDVDERQAWEHTLPLVEELLSADTVLIGAPMYNLGPPAALKAWIDRVTFPGALDDPATGVGRLCRTAVVMVCPRGGAYGPGAPREGWDHAIPYLRAWWAAHGVAEDHLHVVVPEMTVAGLMPHLTRFQAYAGRSLAAAEAEVDRLASIGPLVERPAWVG